MPRHIVLLLATLATAQAQLADIDHLYPAGAQRGTSVTVSIPGLHEKAQLWTDHPSLTAKVTGKDQAQIHIHQDTPPGLHWLRAYDTTSASPPRWFSVGTLTEAQETEPNHTLATAMPVDHLPLCMNGVLEENTCIDFFALQLQAGDTLTAALEAYQLGSEVDPYLELYDSEGHILATAHDGRSLDPLLVYPITHSGRYLLQVAGFLHPPSSTVKYTGADSLVYRLHLHQQPVITHSYPTAVSRTQPTALTLHSTAPANPSQTEIPPKDWPADPLIQTLNLPSALWPLPVLVTDHPIHKETEPNDTAARANPIAINTILAGQLATLSDTDSYSFTVKKGQNYRLQLHTRQLLLPLDGYLTLYDSADKLLAENDDQDSSGSTDAVISWKATLDGPVRIVVSTHLPVSGPGAQYLLALTPGTEPLEAHITQASVALTPGKTAEIKGKLIAQNGYSGKIRAQLQNLPLGISADPVDIQPKHHTEFTLTLRAAKNAKAWSGPIQLALWASEKDGTATTILGHHLARGEAQRHHTTLDRIDHLWLTLHTNKNLNSQAHHTPMHEAKKDRWIAEHPNNPAPIIDIRTFFYRNHDLVSIGCNLHEHPRINRFRQVWESLLSRSDVSGVYARIKELDTGGY
jgi:hypothetical protein